MSKRSIGIGMVSLRLYRQFTFTSSRRGTDYVSSCVAKCQLIILRRQRKDLLVNHSSSICKHHKFHKSPTAVSAQYDEQEDCNIAVEDGHLF